MEILKKIKNGITKVLFPSNFKCIFCDEELPDDNSFCVCEKCFEKLPFNDEHICEKCGEAVNDESTLCLNCKKNIERNFYKARAPFVYKNEIINTIHNLKYNNAKYLGKPLSNFLVAEVFKNNWQIDLVIPIPLSKERFKQRGYNQSELLCDGFITKMNLPVVTNLLIRVKNTPTQTNLTKKERLTNLQKAFEVTDKSKIKGKNILLVDDVFTTGATMEEASKVLNKAKAKNVYCISLAHVKKPVSYDDNLTKIDENMLTDI